MPDTFGDGVRNARPLYLRQYRSCLVEYLVEAAEIPQSRRVPYIRDIMTVYQAVPERELSRSLDIRSYGVV